MRTAYYTFFPAIFFVLTISSCKKELTFKASGTSSLTIVNGVANNAYFYLNFEVVKSKEIYFNGSSALRYANSVFFNSYSGEQKLGLYTLNDTNAGSKPVFDLTLDLPINTVQTLFLTGTSEDPDHFVTTTELPYHPPVDSVMGLRFVNMVKGSDPVSVNLVGAGNGSEADEIPYQGITVFKTYSAGSSISQYSFEFRDKSTGELLGSCTVDGVNNDGSSSMPNIRRNRNYTIALLSEPAVTAPDRVLIIDEKVKY